MTAILLSLMLYRPVFPPAVKVGSLLLDIVSFFTLFPTGQAVNGGLNAQS